MLFCCLYRDHRDIALQRHKKIDSIKKKISVPGQTINQGLVKHRENISIFKTMLQWKRFSTQTKLKK